MIHLGTIQLSGNSASVVFEGIPQNYRELIFALELRTTGSEAQRWTRVNVSPGPTTNANPSVSPFWPGFLTVTASSSATVGAGHALAANSLATTGTFAYSSIRFPNYASNGGPFVGLSTQANLVNGGGTGFRNGSISGPITTLTFTTLDGSSFVTGSRFSIYALPLT